MIANAVGNGAASGPYVGLRSYRTGESNLFFGRARESLEIARLWRAKKLTLLYGSSGVGKTSLLEAGIIPELDKSRFDVLPVGRIRASPLYPAAVPVRNPYTFALLSSWAPAEPPRALANVTIADYLHQHGESPDRYGDPKPILVAIDQVEELFTNLPEGQFLQPFLGQLTEALNEFPEVRILLSLREDYLATVLPYEQFLAGQSRTRVRLLPFGEEAALEAICEPLRGTGRSFEPNAAEQLVADLRTIKVTNARGDESTITVDSIEPVQVQIVCSALWDALPADAAVITSAHVREHANVDRFLATFCRRALNTVAKEHGIPAARIRSWLQETFITELGTRGTAYQGIEETAGMPNRVIRALEDLHILKAEHRSFTRWYELQHDRLLDPIRQADPAENLEAAKVARSDGNWDLVERNARQAMRAYGADELRVRAEAEYLLGEASARRGDADAAVDHYHRAAGLFEVLQDLTQVGESLAEAGRVSLARGRQSAAAEDLRAAIVRIPDDKEVQTDLAQALWFSGQQHASLAILNSVLAQESNLVPALRTRGEILADMGKAAYALYDLDRVRYHQEPSTQAARALALALEGRFDAAGQEAADALANGGDNGPMLLRVARVRALTGRRDEAAQLAMAALAATERPLPPHLKDYAQRLLGEVSGNDAESTGAMSP